MVVSAFCRGPTTFRASLLILEEYVMKIKEREINKNSCVKNKIVKNSLFFLIAVMDSLNAEAIVFLILTDLNASCAANLSSCIAIGLSEVHGIPLVK